MSFLDTLKGILDAVTKKGIVFIISLVITFDIFPPLGIFLLLYKVGVFDGFFQRRPTARNINSDSQQSARMEKYRIMTEGRSAESIDYLASALGVQYSTALRDLQQMVAEGRFGPEAYINYVDKTLVLQPRRSSAGQSRASADSARASEIRNAMNEAARAAEEAMNNASGGSKGASSSKNASGSRSKAQKASEDAKTDAGSKNPDTGLLTLLLIVGLALMALGGFAAVGAAEGLIDMVIDGIWSSAVVGTFATALGVLGGGIVALCSRASLKKRGNRFKMYLTAIAGRDYVPLSELASKAGISVRKVKKDLEAMLEKDLLPSTAYIDQGDGTLVLKPGASPKVEDDPVPPEDTEDRYKAILREIRELNDAIPDREMTDRIDEMESLTAKIFQAVQDKPEKLPQIKSFMSYYLPTTLKLLRTYADFESSGADGDNIRSARGEIERILETLVDGFRKQLDKLFESDAMDIASDIDVLENMLRRDGLTGDGSAFGGAAAAMGQARAEMKERD